MPAREHRPEFAGDHQPVLHRSWWKVACTSEKKLSKSLRCFSGNNQNVGVDIVRCWLAVPLSVMEHRVAFVAGKLSRGSVISRAFYGTIPINNIPPGPPG